MSAVIAWPRLKQNCHLPAPGGAANIMAAAIDVSRIEDLAGLETAVHQRFGGTDILMNNAGVQPGSNMFGPRENWQRVLSVNLWGVINGAQGVRTAYDRARGGRA